MYTHAPFKPPRIAIDLIFFQLGSSGIAIQWMTALEYLANTIYAENIVLLRRKGTNISPEGFKTIIIDQFSYNNHNHDISILDNVCKQHEIDVLISTYYTYSTAVLNVGYFYDMIPEKCGYDLNNPEWVQKARYLKHIDYFITTTYSNKSDLLLFYPNKDPNKIFVVNPALQEHFRSRSAEEIQNFLYKYAIPTKYVLVAGGLADNKNIDLLLACNDIFLQNNLAVLLTGGKIPKNINFKQINNWFFHRLAYEEISMAYSAAVCCVSPSLAEGFGLPIIEAILTGCPVLCNNIPVYREIAGPYLTYFNNDIGSFKDCMEYFLANQKKFNNVSKLFRERFCGRQLAIDFVECVINIWLDLGIGLQKVKQCPFS